MRNTNFNRRNFLKSATAGFGYTAFASLAAQEALDASSFKSPLVPKKPHFEPKVKRVIFLFMQGAPTQHETFDYNPELEKHAGQNAEMDLAIGRQGGKILPPVYKFDRCGESGLPISEVFPHLQKHADELCLLNGMHTDTPAHPQASIFTHTGNITFVRPVDGFVGGLWPRYREPGSPRFRHDESAARRRCGAIRLGFSAGYVSGHAPQHRRGQRPDRKYP